METRKTYKNETERNLKTNYINEISKRNLSTSMNKPGRRITKNASINLLLGEM